MPIAAVVADLERLGVRRGGVLLVHTSYRAIGPVEGGPLGLVAALRSAVGTEGTLVMPTMSSGEDVFDPRTTPSEGMGITAELFRQQEGVVRSTHPGGSFAAEGPLAVAITAPQPLEPPHGPESPPGRVHELGGQVLLLGVTQGESTTLHVAEAIARVPYSVDHLCVVEIDGVARGVLIAETDHCCKNFEKVDAWLGAKSQLAVGPVGNGTAKLAESRDVVSVAVEHLREDPLVFLCAERAGCEECDLARDSIR